VKHTQTIAAIATSYGQGSISIIRISGSDALKYALKLINPANTKKQKTLSPRVASLHKLYSSNNELLDEAICIYFKAPHSYTGEDVVELQCHGGSIVSQMVLDCLYSFGVVSAKNGEFSKRAFLNNKIDLTKASAISALIGAKSQKSAKLLARITQGELKELIDSIVNNLLKALSASEVSIDYSDEDLPLDLSKQINTILQDTISQLQDLQDRSKQKQGILKGFNVAIIGKPNVGKSSLLNKILNDDRAIVTSTAGTTRDAIKEDFMIDGFMLTLIDTAGIRDIDDDIEKQGIQKSKQIAKMADILIVLFDGSKELSSEDEQIIKLSIECACTKIYAINKRDLSSKIDKATLSKLGVSINANIQTKGDSSNIDELLESLKEYLKKQDMDDIVLISSMAIQNVSDCISSLKMAIDKIQLNNEELELFSFYVYEAIAHLNNITKPVDNEDMLDMMFRDFCLGK